MGTVDEDARIFDEGVRHFGQRRLTEGVFSRERFGSILEQTKVRTLRRIERFRSSGQLIRNMMPVVFDFTDEPILDAYAFLHSRRLIIALSGSGAAVLHHAMFRLLSCRDVLEEIGDSSKERVSLPFAPALRNTILVSTVFECFQRWNRPELLDWLVGIIPRFIEVGRFSWDQ